MVFLGTAAGHENPAVLVEVQRHKLGRVGLDLALVSVGGPRQHLKGPVVNSAVASVDHGNRDASGAAAPVRNRVVSGKIDALGRTLADPGAKLPLGGSLEHRGGGLPRKDSVGG